MSDFNLVCSFYIDTDAYSQRDRQMFVAGFEFCQIFDRIQNNSKGFSTTIHRENESRIRIACGKLGRKCSIQLCELKDDPQEIWAYLEIV